MVKGGGRRADLDNRYFRSSWEANYARYLNLLVAGGRVWKWEYEPDTFEFPVRRGTRFYTPDFKIFPSASVVSFFYYIEVKGYFDAKSRTIARRMKLHHPAVTVFYVQRGEYDEIWYLYGRQIPEWEK